MIRPASKSAICPQLFRFDQCRFQEKYGFLCPYSHSIIEARLERSSLYFQRKKQKKLSVKLKRNPNNKFGNSQKGLKMSSSEFIPLREPETLIIPKSNVVSHINDNVLKIFEEKTEKR